MSRYGLWISATVVAVVLLGFIWWGWQRGGLALMQLGMGVC